MEQTKEVCHVRDIVAYMMDENNVWNPEKYVQNRTLSGKSFDQESLIRFQYCRGNAYAEGHVGNFRFQLYFSNLQGFQFHVLSTMDGTPLKPKVFSYSPHRFETLLGVMEDWMG